MTDVITQTQIEIPNITLGEVSITSSNQKYVLYPRENSLSQEYFIFDQITITEDMFAESIFGTLVFNDSSYIIDQLNLTSSDKISFTVDSNPTYEFNILDVIIDSNLASKNIHGPAGSVHQVIIRFSSNEFIYKNFNVSLLENFIGKISKNSGAAPPEQTSLDFDSGQLSAAEAQMTGLVQKLFTDDMMTKDSGKNLEAHNTYNDVWVKAENFLFPFYKLGNNLRISHLMNYVCEYACSLNNKNAVNFFFWEDLQSWNFKCIDELLKESDNYKGTYNLGGLAGSDNSFLNTVVEMRIISDISPSKLLNGGAIFGEYVRIMPDWGNIYRNFSDNATGLTKMQITYNYEEDSKNWGKISPHSFLSSKTNIEYKKQNDYSFVRTSDYNYGFYSTAYNSEKKPWWNFYDFSINKYYGKNLGVENSEQIKTKEHLIDNIPNSKEVSRTENEYWQSQFDFSELPGAFLKKIYKEIKWPLTKNRWNYAEAKKTKTEWGVYKNVVCCDSFSSSNDQTDFYALIYAADKIYGGNSLGFEGVCGATEFNIDPGGIYAYSWQQVEFWPKSEVKDILESSFEIIEFEDADSFSFPFVFVSNKKSLKGNFDYTEGYTGPDNRAYNLSEILNTSIPKSFENKNDKNHTTITTNSGVSMPLHIEDTDRKSYSSYPKKYQMMPVGKFRVIDNNCPDFSQSGTEISEEQVGKNESGMYYGGRIVHMKVLSSSNLDMIRGFTLPQELPLKKQRPYMFLFDVDNTHDGLCTGDCA